jgi:hypothetical protein
VRAGSAQAIYPEKAFEAQRREGKTMCDRNLLGHQADECQIDFMSLFPLRLRAFAVMNCGFQVY